MVIALFFDRKGARKKVEKIEKNFEKAIDKRKAK